jgi:hypothetical protein
MSKFNWMPILRTGTFTDKNKQTVTIDEAALDKIVEQTDLTKEPQLVIEHPKFDEIGFGSVEQLKRVGDFLYALPKIVEEKFKKAVNGGKLPGRSVTLDKNNFALKNISFLPPDIPPAVSGLGVYSFSSHFDELSVTEEMKLELAIPGVESHFADIETSDFEFADYEVSSFPFRTIQSVLRNIKNYFIENKSLEDADKIIPEYYLEEIGNPPHIWEKPAEMKTNYFSQNTIGDTMNIELSKLDPAVRAAIETLQSENTQLKTDLDGKVVELQSVQKVITDAQKEKDRNEVLQFCEGDMKLKILPKDKENFVTALLSVKEKGVIELSAEDGTKTQFDTYEFLKEQFKLIPDKIELSEIATGETAGIKDADNAEVLAQKALEFQSAEKEAGRNVSMSAAVQYVRAKLTGK